MAGDEQRPGGPPSKKDADPADLMRQTHDVALRGAILYEDHRGTSRDKWGNLSGRTETTPPDLAIELAAFTKTLAGALAGGPGPADYDEALEALRDHETEGRLRGLDWLGHNGWVDDIMYAEFHLRDEVSVVRVAALTTVVRLMERTGSPADPALLVAALHGSTALERYLARQSLLGKGLIESSFSRPRPGVDVEASKEAFTKAVGEALVSPKYEKRLRMELLRGLTGEGPTCRELARAEIGAFVAKRLEQAQAHRDRAKKVPRAPGADMAARIEISAAEQIEAEVGELRKVVVESGNSPTP